MDTKLNIEDILEAHKKWLYNEEGGERANLRGANLRYANLRYANLRGANLEDANLIGANLRYANLIGANLIGANLRGANLRGANLIGANLRYANLRYANLRGANLIGANLWSLVGNKKNVKTIQIEKYDITYTKEVMQIGCQKHSIDEWFAFSDEKIAKMDCDALEWWNKWKETIKNIIEMSPAEQQP